ncbi:hypothetical protein BC826DRAFT_1109263 [Russula brevipes]|nr:hypothetical protein BC826DRAFT_1109263 [Russula brevipes]
MPAPTLLSFGSSRASVTLTTSPTRIFLETERITLADITLVADLRRAFTTTAAATLRAKLPKMPRHFETIEKAPAAPAQPKTEKKPKKEEVDGDDDDKLYEEAPKEKNPFDLLPKSTLNLEDWKRAYPNKDTRGADGSLEWLYQNFDKEGYSLWRVGVQYNEELTQTYDALLERFQEIAGFFNRLEASRKYLFGSVGVIGTTKNSIITGALIARGQEIRLIVEVAPPDWESYTYEHIDLDNAEQKAFFEAALAWTLKFS